MKISYIYEHWLDLNESDIQKSLCEYHWSEDCRVHIRNCGDGWNEPRESYCVLEEHCPFLEKEIQSRFQDDIDDGTLDDWLQDGVENDMEDTFVLNGGN